MLDEASARQFTHSFACSLGVPDDLCWRAAHSFTTEYWILDVVRRDGGIPRAAVTSFSADQFVDIERKADIAAELTLIFHELGPTRVRDGKRHADP